MSVFVIIGKNFGDEGKGLATDYFASLSEEQGKSCLVIRHNGGAQAGHTVDLTDKRFVFHQLSSGSFRNADTYWSKSFLPDLYKLCEEVDGFFEINGNVPFIYAHPMCRCVCIDDVLVNMALESSRGNSRHGSCGMGINEAVERSSIENACIYLHQIGNMSAQALYNELARIRREYLPLRLKALGLTLSQMGEYGELLANRNVLLNAAEQMRRAAESVMLKDETIAYDYGDIVFEGAQGLLLDEDYLPFAPHLTSSKTGLDNPMRFIGEHLPNSTFEVVYVTRSYVTRHGAGPLPHEELWNLQNVFVVDNTNLNNPWQGSLRFAPHGTQDEFFASLRGDIEKYRLKDNVSCMITHLNETDGAMCGISGKASIEQWFCGANMPKLRSLYLSDSPYSQDICRVKPSKKTY